MTDTRHWTFWCASMMTTHANVSTLAEARGLNGLTPTTIIIGTGRRRWDSMGEFERMCRLWCWLHVTTIPSSVRTSIFAARHRTCISVAVGVGFIRREWNWFGGVAFVDSLFGQRSRRRYGVLSFLDDRLSDRSWWRASLALNLGHLWKNIWRRNTSNTSVVGCAWHSPRAKLTIDGALWATSEVWTDRPIRNWSGKCNEAEDDERREGCTDSAQS